MTFSWHCRECDAKGEVTTPMDKLNKFINEANNSFIGGLTLFVFRTIHSTCNGDIGVKAL